MSAAIALLASLSWGVGDFVAGHRSRTVGALRVALLSQVMGLLLVALLFTLGVAFTSLTIDVRPLVIGAVAGSVGAIGLLAFYRAMSLGPLALMPPIAASGVVLPVTFGIIVEQVREPIAFVGIALAIIGVVLAALPPTGIDTKRAIHKMSRVALLIAIISAVGFAGFQILVDVAGDDSTLDALVAILGIRVGGALTMTIAMTIARGPAGFTFSDLERRDVSAIAVVAVCDTLANASFAIAAATGSFAAAALLASLYPAVTSGLAWLLLREQLGRVQLLGAATTLVGVVMLTM